MFSDWNVTSLGHNTDGLGKDKIMKASRAMSLVKNNVDNMPVFEETEHGKSGLALSNRHSQDVS